MKNERLDSSLIQKIEKFINEGIEITRLSQENDVRYLPKTEETNFYVWEIKDQYVIWKLECNRLVEKIGYHNSIFAESNSISLTSGTVIQPPINPNSIIGQKMLIDIRKETSTGLDFLRKILENNNKIESSTIKDIIKITGKNGKLIFNRETGSLTFNKTKFNFPPGQQKFNIIEVILSSPDNQGLYKDIAERLGFSCGCSSNRKIQLIVKSIKYDLTILPKNSKSAPDIFKPVPRIGYRINLS